ncbi:MAG TPA: Hsp20/alpha crystallin family protein [Candidatus Eremiobacteraeota bacterium]|nr:MAG: Spore protein SP21 [bacterium ADurb.Bin363]HPZ10467.1 Hsp20/alpha crystallin family protein [Candidatus Eremiobacteraeota bacterium]
MLVRWNPFNEMNSLQREINRLFSDTLMKGEGTSETPLAGRAWTPAVDIVENEKEIIVKVELPGMEQKDIDVALEDNQLTIKGERKFEKEEKGDNYIRQERVYGSFYRAFTVGTAIQHDKITASYKNGILEITLPKEEKVQPKKIEIK